MDEHENEKRDELTSDEARRFAALERAHPVDRRREDALMETLADRGIIRRRLGGRRWWAPLLAAAAVFVAGFAAGYIVHKPIPSSNAGLRSGTDGQAAFPVATRLGEKAMPPGGRSNVIWF